MDFVTHLPRTLQRHDTIWVIVDRLTKSAHFLVVRITSTLKEFYRLYIREIVRLHRVPVSIVSRSQVHDTLLEEFPKGHRDAVDNEYCVPSMDRWSIGEDHTSFRGHAASLCPVF